MAGSMAAVELLGKSLLLGALGSKPVLGDPGSALKILVRLERRKPPTLHN